MKTEKIGIVVEMRDENRIIGYLARVHVSMDLDEYWRTIVKMKIGAINFIYLTKKEKFVC